MPAAVRRDAATHSRGTGRASARPAPASRRSAWTCPGRRRRCSPRWTACRWRSPPGRALSSVTAVLRGGKPGPAVLLRGDMDALPVTESTGRDVHLRRSTARCTRAATTCTPRCWSARRSCSPRGGRDLAGHVVFMFQPGEEGWGGAGHDDRRGRARRGRRAARSPPTACTSCPRCCRSGVFATRPGPLMAASDGLFVKVIGRGGHGSAPHRRRPDPGRLRDGHGAADDGDPPVRRVRPGGGHGRRFHAGTADNIIPDEATFEATVRSF